MSETQVILDAVSHISATCYILIVFMVILAILFGLVAFRMKNEINAIVMSLTPKQRQHFYRVLRKKTDATFQIPKGK